MNYKVVACHGGRKKVMKPDPSYLEPSRKAAIVALEEVESAEHAVYDLRKGNDVEVNKTALAVFLNVSDALFNKEYTEDPNAVLTRIYNRTKSKSITAVTFARQSKDPSTIARCLQKEARVVSHRAQACFERKADGVVTRKLFKEAYSLFEGLRVTLDEESMISVPSTKTLSIQASTCYEMAYIKFLFKDYSAANTFAGKAIGFWDALEKAAKPTAGLAATVDPDLDLEQEAESKASCQKLQAAAREKLVPKKALSPRSPNVPETSKGKKK